MASGWAEEAERQAEAVERDLAEVGRGKGFRFLYQRREARFALRVGTTTAYFSAHDYESRNGMDWLQLRIDVLTRVRQGMQGPKQVERSDAAEEAPQEAVSPSPS